MPKRALIVGINSYLSPGNDLHNAVSDAEEIAERLRRHEDETPNYECRVLLDKLENGHSISRGGLRDACRRLFSDFSGETLFYFSGHGVLSDTAGYLCTSDAEENDWGVRMDEVLEFARNSQSCEILLILDCCHSGKFGNPSLLQTGGTDLLALLRQNMTILAASRPEQPAIEELGHGLFTAAVLDALDGGAADHMGWVTAPSIYAYVRRRFGAWDQTPVYKTYATQINPVRECAPLIERLSLRKLIDLFPRATYEYRLDRDYDPEDEHGNIPDGSDPERRKIGKLFKDYRDAGLLRPTDPTEQLFWTARRGHCVQLTPRGREYWWLVKNGKI